MATAGEARRTAPRMSRAGRHGGSRARNAGSGLSSGGCGLRIRNIMHTDWLAAMPFPVTSAGWGRFRGRTNEQSFGPFPLVDAACRTRAGGAIGRQNNVAGPWHVLGNPALYNKTAQERSRLSRRDRVYERNRGMDAFGAAPGVAVCVVGPVPGRRVGLAPDCKRSEIVELRPVRRRFAWLRIIHGRLPGLGRRRRFCSISVLVHK